MKRRTFLRNGFLLSAGLAVTGISKLEAATDPKWRTFVLTTTIEIPDPEGDVRVWLPLPLNQTTDYFQLIDSSWKGNFENAQKLHHGSAGILLAEWNPNMKAAPKVEFTSKFKTRNRYTDFSKSSKRKEDSTVLNHYLKPSRLVVTDGIVAETSQKIIGGKQSDIDKARAIYEWIVENTYRDPKVRGCGVGDISSMLKTGNLGGKCADLNALFVGLCRSAGLPSRHLYGIRCAKSSEFNSLGREGDVTGSQHCRAEVYLVDHGWVPADPADVRKVILEESQPQQLSMNDPRVQKAREKLFGSWEMNWMPYNYEHDVRLPESNGPELGYLMYPQAETANGRKDCLDSKNFKYTITATEIV